MKSLSKLALCLLLAMSLTVSAFAAQVPDSLVAENLNGQQRLVKTYTLSPEVDPDELKEEDFSYDGYLYTWAYTTKVEHPYLESKTVTETVTVNTAKNDLAQILAELSPSMPYEKDGFSGELALDHTTLSTEASGYTTKYSKTIKISAYDKAANLGVSITKRGNAQVMAGQSMRYDLTIANTSNVPLESFFWHDKIPYDVARPTTLTTGTYSARLNYRILYKTNCNTSYQVLASNLLTSNNYSFSLNAIPMQAGEVVTDIYFDFGKVPVGFQSVVNPTLSVMVNGNAVNGYQMVNRADVGGKYQGTWQTATASWVTVVRRLWNVPTLPKTGY